MPFAAAAGIDICYETFGDSERPAMLLVMGLGCQLIHWPEEFCRALAKRGFWVIRFDNRDVGLSTKLEHLGSPPMVRNFLRKHAGLGIRAPYRLEDMADDAFHLLNALGVARAHVVGVSMGGMIAQIMALRGPARVRSLCSWMSTTGDDRVARPTMAALRTLITPPPRELDALQDHAVAVWRILGSKGALFDEERVRRRAAEAFTRSPYRRGFPRQSAAIMAARPRDVLLRDVQAPTLVMHGLADPLVPPSAGRATAAAIPNAQLELFEDMGHDLPEKLWPRFVDAIERNAARALRP